MNQKKIFYAEWAYIVGLSLIALGTAFVAKSNFGMSMVVAPAYVLHLKVSQVLPFFSFGMAEYCLQAFLLLILGLCMRKFKMSYLYSFFTAIIYGVLLDLFGWICSFLVIPGMAGRIIFYILGLYICTWGVAIIFKTYISPEAYELLVLEISNHFHFPVSKTKTVYDISSALVAIVMSFAFFGLGHFEGIGIGTIISAMCSGALIGMNSKLLDSMFQYKDALSLRPYFEK